MTFLPSVGRPSPPSPAPDLVDPESIRARLKDHARAAAGACAPNTVRALAADSRVFSAWCVGQGRDALPAIALRDAALAAVALDMLLRRSELVSLRIEDLAPASDEGATILVRKSKTDQGGEGAAKFFAPDTARSVRAYLGAIGGPTEGPLLRSVTRWGRAAETAVEPQEVPRLIRRLAAAAGVRTTRVGAARDMLAAGLERGEVMQAGSWKSVAMVARYGERLRSRAQAGRPAEQGLTGTFGGIGSRADPRRRGVWTPVPSPLSGMKEGPRPPQRVLRGARRQVWSVASAPPLPGEGVEPGVVREGVADGLMHVGELTAPAAS